MHKTKHGAQSLFIFLISILIASKSLGEITAHGLRTEYLQNPLGIDVVQPRLSWKLSAKEREDRSKTRSIYRWHLPGSSWKQAKRIDGIAAKRKAAIPRSCPMLVQHSVVEIATTGE